jgi:predicted transglutaminase-like cysteine proteinase
MAIRANMSASLSLALILAGCVADPTVESSKGGHQVMPPYGYIGLCLRDASQCKGGTDILHRVIMTDEKHADLERINDWVNDNVPQYPDKTLYGQPEYWSVATNRGGDCEDIALLKQKLLMARGWPMDALLIAIVRDWSGSGHAVLIVIADQGWFTLDNKTWRIWRGEDMPYTFVKRQSRYRPYIWTDAMPTERPIINYQPVNAEPSFLKAARRMAEVMKRMMQ